MGGAVDSPLNDKVHEHLVGLKLEGGDDDSEHVNGSAPDADTVEVKKKKKKNKKKTTSAAVDLCEAVPEVAKGNHEVSNGNHAVSNGNHAVKDGSADDDEEGVEAGGDEAAKKKKKKPKSKKKKGGLEQTDPPSIPVADLFPLGEFPEGEIQNYKDDNLWRTTSEEKRAQERIEKPMYNGIRQAAEVHRQVDFL